MTDEEMAEEWLNERYLKDMGVRKPCKKAFLAGLKAVRPQWHKVADGDLPLKTTLVLIKICGCFILGWLDDNDVWHNDSDNGTRIPKDLVIAWCEIPKYTEE